MILSEEKKLTEIMANLEHQRWSRWQKYLFSLCKKNKDGSMTIPAESVERWQRQINTMYRQLSNEEKKSDRNEAFRSLEAVHIYLEDHQMI